MVKELDLLQKQISVLLDSISPLTNLDWLIVSQKKVSNLPGSIFCSKSIALRFVVNKSIDAS